jgi:hypothetical protein
MKLDEMKVDPKLFDRTTLDEAEQQFVLDVLAAVGTQITNTAMTKGVVPAVQAGAGAVLRMVKANLERGLVVASTADIPELRYRPKGAR